MEETIIMEENVIVIRDAKTFYFDFDCAKDVDENLKHEIELIIKSNESLVESNITNELVQLLLTLFRMGGENKKAPYQIFLCNFCQRRN